MRLKYLFAFCFALIVPAAAQARPVSYPSGWTVMLRNDATINSAHVHYTPDPKHSIGLRLIYDPDGDFVYTGAQVNRLIKRWNKRDSQANIYALSQPPRYCALCRGDRGAAYMDNGGRASQARKQRPASARQSWGNGAFTLFQRPELTGVGR